MQSLFRKDELYPNFFFIVLFCLPPIVGAPAILMCITNSPMSLWQKDCLPWMETSCLCK